MVTSRGRTFNETRLDRFRGAVVPPYSKSKTFAERAAWDFIAREGGALELSVVNPVGVFGPVLGADFSPSILIVQRLMDGALPGCPALTFGVVDVRDVADLHLRAMTSPRPKANASSPSPAIYVDARHRQDAQARMGAAAKRVPTRELPNWLVRIVALRDPAVRSILPELGQIKSATNEKAQRVLGWAPRSSEDAIVASAESLIRFGFSRTVREGGRVNVGAGGVGPFMTGPGAIRISGCCNRVAAALRTPDVPA